MSDIYLIGLKYQEKMVSNLLKRNLNRNLDSHKTCIILANYYRYISMRVVLGKKVAGHTQPHPFTLNYVQLYPLSVISNTKKAQRRENREGNVLEL